MAHYNHAEWRLYRQGRLDGKRRAAMEKHLLHCESCLEAYLGAMEKHEPAMAELLLPADFKERMLGLLRERQRRRPAPNRSRALLHYGAAAAVTLLLMAGGVFDFVARDIPGLLQETNTVSKVIHNITGSNWSEQLVDATADRIGKLWETKEGW